MLPNAILTIVWDALIIFKTTLYTFHTKCNVGTYPNLEFTDNWPIIFGQKHECDHTYEPYSLHNGMGGFDFWLVQMFERAILIIELKKNHVRLEV